jgi:hypothetical protein
LSNWKKRLLGCLPKHLIVLTLHFNYILHYIFLLFFNLDVIESLKGILQILESFLYKVLDKRGHFSAFYNVLHSEGDCLVLFLFFWHVVKLDFEKSVLLLSFLLILELINCIKGNDIDGSPLTEAFLFFHLESFFQDLKFKIGLVGAFLIVCTIHVSGDRNYEVNLLLFVTNG